MTLNHTINFEKYSYDKNILGTTVQVLKNGMHWGLIKLIQKSPSKLRRRFILRCLASITEFLLDIIIFRYFRSYISHSAEVLRFWSKIFDIFFRISRLCFHGRVHVPLFTTNRGAGGLYMPWRFCANNIWAKTGRWLPNRISQTNQHPGCGSGCIITHWFIERGTVWW